MERFIMDYPEISRQYRLPYLLGIMLFCVPLYALVASL
jgi:hypothetical protein